MEADVALGGDMLESHRGGQARSGQLQETVSSTTDSRPRQRTVHLLDPVGQVGRDRPIGRANRGLVVSDDLVDDEQISLGF